MDLTIIVPTYNRSSERIQQCIQCVNHNDVEIIVVDDCSAKPVEVPPGVRVIRHDRTRGRAASINTGLKAANHDLVLLLDDEILAAADLEATAEILGNPTDKK